MPKTRVEELVGTFSHVKNRFQSGMVIAALEDGSTIKGVLEDGEELIDGMSYRFMGRTDNHPRYGKQFWFSSFVLATPHTRRAVVKYLTTYAEGVGVVKANDLFEAFGPGAVKVLADEPARVIEAKILSPERAAEASETLRGMEATQATRIDLMGLLDGKGFPKKIVSALIKKFGASADRDVREDPYLLLRHFKGAGFLRTDRLYLDLKHDPASLPRQMYCVWHHLRSSTAGHTWHPIEGAVQALRDSVSGAKLQPTKAIELGIKEERLAVWNGAITKDGWVAEAAKAANERTVAEEIRRLLGVTGSLWPSHHALSDRLTPHQREQLGLAMRLPVAILIGTPGCLAGDSVIEVSRARKSYRASIAHVVKYMGGGSHAGRRWDESIPTLARTMSVDGAIRLMPVLSSCSSGDKMTYELKTVTGRTVRATADHPFLTEHGFKDLQFLKPGDFLFVDGGVQATGRRKRKPLYRQVEGLVHHPHAGRRLAVCEHRLVVEAEMNGMSLADFVSALRAERLEVLLHFLPLSQVVHHKNDDSLDNRPENLELVGEQADHAGLHGRESAWRHVTARAVLEEVASVKPYAVEPTYDLSLGEPHNFLASGFVVHNTGKTFCAAAVAAALCRSLGPKNVAACAPTGKAAVRLTQKFREYDVPLAATTIHRLLKVGPSDDGYEFACTKFSPLEQKVFILDEASMVDTDLFAHLLSALPPAAHLFLVGDPNQLTPVGHGAPLRDMLSVAALPRGELTEIKRNAGLIVTACRDLKDGRPYETCSRFDKHVGLNLRHVPCGTPEAAVETVESILASVLGGRKWDVLDDVQVIVAVNDKSPLARKKLNGVLQNLLNPSGRTAGQNPFRVGDKCICLKNGLNIPLQRAASLAERPDVVIPVLGHSIGRRWFKDADGVEWCDLPGAEKTVFVANGEIGRVCAVDERLTVMRFRDPDRVIKVPMGRQEEDEDSEEKGRGCNFDLGFCVTGHRMQGSECPVVIVMIDDYAGAGFVCSREWWYTALSRASELCITIGRQSTVEKHCRRVVLNDRKTFLAQLLAQEMGL